MFFVANPNDPAWCYTAIHHSDEIILLAEAKADPQISESELGFLDGHVNLRAQITLLLLHEDNTQSPQGTSHWLEARNVSPHVHIRKKNRADFARVDRILSGTATGLVFAGAVRKVWLISASWKP